MPRHLVMLLQHFQAKGYILILQLNKTGHCFVFLAPGCKVQHTFNTCYYTRSTTLVKHSIAFYTLLVLLMFLLQQRKFANDAGSSVSSLPHLQWCFPIIGSTARQLLIFGCLFGAHWFTLILGFHTGVFCLSSRAKVGMW